MVDKLIYEQKVSVGEDRKLVIEIQLPEDTPVGEEVTVSVTQPKPIPTEPELTPEEEAALDAELEALLNDPTTFTGLGLTAEEIAKSPEIGMWADREDSVAWVQEQRRKRRERRLNRD
ncbi:MAG: hypothetical protein IAE80_17795 [Anaerolinea sp.]|nr:hypothetical protein [Anaerolinea sp.]